MDFNDFINALSNPATCAALAPGFVKVTPGDWNGLITWAASEGYTFTLNDVLNYFNSNPGKADALANQPAPFSSWEFNDLQAAVAQAQ